MFFYIFVSLISTVLVYIAHRASINIISKLALLFTILIPSIIGGCRDVTIGTDLQGYGILFFDQIRYYDSVVKLLTEWNYSPEYGYVLLNYISSRISDDIHFFLFLSELIKISLVVFTAWYYRKSIPPYIVVFTYMMFMYWYGFSLLRQSLAICICFFSIIFFINRKYVCFSLLVIVAYFFHNSAIFFFILPLLNIVYKRIKHPGMVMLILTVVIYFCSSALFYITANSGLFRVGVFERYENSGVLLSKSNLLMSCFILLSTILIKQRRLKCDEYYLYLVQTNTAFSILFLLLSQYFEVAFRLSFYQMIFLMVYYPFILRNYTNSPLRKIYMTTYILVYIFHYFVSANHGLAETIPYSSKILNL